MAKTVIYVEKEKFLRDMMEKALISAGVSTYTYSDSDCMHFIQDLNPAVLILDAATIDDSFIKQINTQIPIILVGESNSLKSITSTVKLIVEKPLGPFDLVAKTLQLLSH